MTTQEREDETQEKLNKNIYPTDKMRILINPKKRPRANQKRMKIDGKSLNEIKFLIFGSNNRNDPLMKFIQAKDYLPFLVELSGLKICKLD